MGEGEISEVSRSIGRLEGTIHALGEQIGTLTNIWMERDRAASVGRSQMYDKINNLASKVDLLGVTVERLTPIVDAGHDETLRASGVRGLLKIIWVGFIALMGAFGATAINWWYAAPKSHH